MKGLEQEKRDQTVTRDALDSILSGDAGELEVHLQLLERDLAIGQSKVRMHCHCLTVDANGRVRLARLAEFMRAAVADYACPKSKLSEARARDLKFRSTSAVASLHQEALKLFTDLKTTGEGGEMLLYLLAERFLKLPQILCKMDLKTDTRMHYHGADGVYASVSQDGVLHLYWGESKVFGNVAQATRECLASLAPFLLESDSQTASRERDLLLLRDKADLDDPALTMALRRYFDHTVPLSNRVKYCGLALVGFDANFYPTENAQIAANVMAAEARKQIAKWKTHVGNRLVEEKLEQFQIEFLFVPLPSAEDFRSAFLKALGL